MLRNATIYESIFSLKPPDLSFAFALCAACIFSSTVTETASIAASLKTLV